MHVPLYLRLVLAAAFVLLAGTFALRSAMVAAYTKTNAPLAARWWPDHPEVSASVAMIEVGHAAGLNQGVPPDTSTRLKALSTRAPLAPEPFLVAGTSELSRGNYSEAETFLLAARERGPRSAATRYLLSELYLRQNRVGAALAELAVFRRLVPALTGALAPALAQFAQTPGAASRMRHVLKNDPDLENLVLTELAADHRNADLILSLAARRPTDGAVPAWQGKLLSALVTGGNYEQAYALWRAFAPPTDVRADLSSFQRSKSPSPFTWTLAEGSAGAVEAAQNGLDVQFTGRANVTLASRTVLLPKGRYVMRMRVSGDVPPAESVSWSLTCLPNDRKAANVSLARPGTLSVAFEVAEECRAQRLELKAVGQTFPETAEFSIRGFVIRRLSAS